MYRTIQVYEWSRLKVGQTYGDVTFEQRHLDALGKYEQINESPFFRTFFNQVRFNQFVGVIRVGDLTIEVLPKTDRSDLKKSQWQSILLELLLISLNVEAKATTEAEITLRKHSVLHMYFHLFLKETQRLIHKGLVRKYRTNVSNQNALKGKLLITKQIVHNSIHLERFYVEHTVYDRDNTYNFLLKETLQCIAMIGDISIKRQAQALLLYFPECTPCTITEKTYSRLPYDRKTESYRRAMELSRIILLNYHPDLKGGRNEILAIMFDMNKLWESFIYWSLKKATLGYSDLTLKAQQRRNFWRSAKGSRLRLVPDLVLTKGQNSKVLDTKWKYESKTSMEDVRQLFAYGKYFTSNENYLLYPATLDNEKVIVTDGAYYNESPSRNKEITNERCGLIFADPIRFGKLNRRIGEEILHSIQ